MIEKILQVLKGRVTEDRDGNYVIWADDDELAEIMNEIREKIENK